MQRVRVGLTGLACVFLLVFLAAAFFGLTRGDITVPDAENNATAAMTGNVAGAEPREPLAELGVTPGNMPEPATASPAPTQTPAASPAAISPAPPAPGRPPAIP
jgi:hypothetical protein